MSWSVKIQDPYPPKSTNELMTQHEDLGLPNRLYDDSHQNVCKRVQPRSGFSIMTSSIRDKSYAESYDNGIYPLSHVEQYTYDLHKKRSSGVVLWEYDMGATEQIEKEEMPTSDVLNEHVKQAFGALEAQSIEPTFEQLHNELKKKKLSEHVIGYILDNVMMHNMMRSLKDASIVVSDETMKAELAKKEISDAIKERVLKRYSDWKQSGDKGT